MNDILAGRTRIIRECMVEIDEVVIDPNVLLRGLDDRHVTRLAECWPLDPILVAEDMTLLDGLHRMAAGRHLGVHQLAARVLAGDRPALLAVAFAANCAPYFPLTARQRAEAGRRLLEGEPELSDRTIARILGISPTTVGRLRRTVVADGGIAPDRRIGMDGKAYTVSHGGDPKPVPPRATGVQNGHLTTSGVQPGHRPFQDCLISLNNGVRWRSRQWWRHVLAWLRRWHVSRTAPLRQPPDQEEFAGGPDRTSPSSPGSRR